MHFISQPHSFHSGGRWGGSRTWGQCCGKSDLPGVRAKAVSLGKCFQESARPLFFSRRAKVLAATQRPSWGGALFYVFAKPCPSSLPPAVSSFCVSSLHLLSFNPLFCGIQNRSVRRGTPETWAIQAAWKDSLLQKPVWGWLFPS